MWGYIVSNSPHSPLGEETFLTCANILGVGNFQIIRWGFIKYPAFRTNVHLIGVMFSMRPALKSSIIHLVSSEAFGVVGVGGTSVSTDIFGAGDGQTTDSSTRLVQGDGFGHMALSLLLSANSCTVAPRGETSCLHMRNNVT